MNSGFATMTKKVLNCSNAACPSQVAHSQGYYNFSLSYKDETTRSHQIPRDVRKAIDTINYNQSQWLLDEDQDVYIFLAKFAVAHNSHLEGLMPCEITRTSVWRSPEVQEVLKGAGPRPVQAPFEPAKEEVTKAVTKATIPPSRLKNAMGRGGGFIGKTGVTIVYPGQTTPTPAGTLPSFESSKDISL